MCFLVVSCGLDSQIARDPDQASKEYVKLYLDGDYAAIYEDASFEMQAHISEEVFLRLNNVLKDLNGKMVDARLLRETSGEYRIWPTTIYEYQVKNAAGQKFDLTAEFLQGYLLRSHLDAPEWADEPDLAKQLVTPIAKLVHGLEYHKIYELLDAEFPLEQVKASMQGIAETCEGVPSRYANVVSQDAKNGKMMIRFVYAYEGEGYLDYRFYIEDDGYKFGGVFFNENTSLKLPAE